MIARAAKARWSLLAGLVALLAAGAAHAQTTCMVDTDCPGTACGSQVCLKSSGGASCTDANTSGVSGAGDGWCADSGGVARNTNCKCAAMGAICDAFSCSFTVPPDGGATGTGGATGSGGGGGSAGATGSAGSAGTSGGGHGGSTGSAGTSGGGGGGCSIAGAPSLGCSAGVALLLAALMRRRTRRRG